MGVALAALAVGGLVVAAPGGATGPKRAHHAVRSLASFVGASNHVQFTLAGCIQDGTITFPSNGPFVCPSDSDYTTGNQGKLWNELDLVPMRLTTNSGNQSDATTDYSVVIAADSLDNNGHPGFDVMSAPVVNTAESDVSCSVSADPSSTGPALTGGASASIYRILTIHQNKNTTCVLDWYQRLGIGSHLFSGSSLQSYLFQTSNFTGSKKTVPLPVSESKPQSLSKDMTATRDSNTPWNLTKSATPDTIAYGNVCDAGFSSTASVGVKITWTKLAAVPSGQVLLVTNIYATNPSARDITTKISDQMYAGTDQSNPVGSPFTAEANVPANTANYLMGTHTELVSSSATQFNDVATGSYVDTVTGITIPQTSTASASATVTAGTTTNTSATVTDTESITGSGLTFSVASPASGSFTNGYTAGTYVTGPVNWSSGSNAITDTGSITFGKTIQLSPAQATTGSLSDTATLNGSDGFGPITAPLTVNISSTKTVSLTINKSLTQAVSSNQTFTFDIYPSGSNIPAATPTVLVTAGTTSGSTTVTGLAAGNYTVHEEPLSPWTVATNDQAVTATNCSNSVSFTNNLAPATAFANKVTQPGGYESGWTFTLTRPDTSTLTGTTDPNGHVVWSGGTTTSASLSAEGTYTISETLKSGWQEVGAAQASGSTGTVTGGTGANAHCSFTVTYPADAGNTYGCDITNQGIGTIVVRKHTTPSGASQSFHFTTTGTGYSGFSLTDGNQNSQQVNAGAYSVSEDSVTGWYLDHATCSTGGSVSGALATIDVPPGGTVTCDYYNTQQSKIVVKKVTIPSGATQSFTFVPSYGSNFNLTDGQSNTSGFLNPGGYSVSENSTTGWDLTSATCDNANAPSAITLGAGQTVTCTFTNTERGSIVVKKVTDPTGSPDTFSFTSNFAGSFTLQDGGSNPTGNLVPGSGYSVSETPLAGYTLSSATCDHGTPSAVQVLPGQTTTCTFTNKIRGHVRVVKTINGAPLTASSPSFTFELRVGDQHTASTAPVETLTTNGTNLGTLDFTTGLVPGQTYAICELLLAGYNPTISGYGPYNPSDAPNYWCWNFSLTFGQAAGNPSLTFTVDNSHPQSKGLTIGFWKNWSACKKSKGNQTDVLGQYLGGITLGTYTFTNSQSDECNAVQTLSKNTFSGKNEASDPLFGMAAQLLAADLNVNDQAGVCSAAVSAINGAQALLVKYVWNGNTYSPKLTSADAALANQYATALDQYNNNQLC